MTVISRVFIIALILFAPLTRATEPTKTDGSDIGITIMGAIVQSDTDNNVALIKNSHGKVMALKKDHIVGNYKVVLITEKYIELITKDAARFIVYQNKFAKDFQTTHVSTGPQLSASDYYREEGFERKKGNVTMTGMYRDQLVKQDLAKVLMQATAEPHMVGGAIVGFKLSQIDDDSIYQKSGLRNGDVITAINNQSLNSVASAVTLLRSLKNSERIEMDVQREGTDFNLSISVVE